MNAGEKSNKTLSDNNSCNVVKTPSFGGVRGGLL